MTVCPRRSLQRSIAMAILVMTALGCGGGKSTPEHQSIVNLTFIEVSLAEPIAAGATTLGSITIKNTGTITVDAPRVRIAFTNIYLTGSVSSAAGVRVMDILPSPPPELDSDSVTTEMTIYFLPFTTPLEPGQNGVIPIRVPVGLTGVTGVHVTIDPHDELAESDELDNQGELLIPIPERG